MPRIACDACGGRGGEIVKVAVDPTRNGDPGNVREEFISCGTCGGSGTIEVPDDDDDDDSGRGWSRR
jgi:hypothetical protein